jgi:hypothetical protein
MTRMKKKKTTTTMMMNDMKIYDQWLVESWDRTSKLAWTMSIQHWIQQYPHELSLYGVNAAMQKTRSNNRTVVCNAGDALHLAYIILLDNHGNETSGFLQNGRNKYVNLQSSSCQREMEFGNLICICIVSSWRTRIGLLYKNE